VRLGAEGARFVRNEARLRWLKHLSPALRATGYNAAYRSLLEREFLGADGKNALNRAPQTLRAAVSAMLREIENLRARLAAPEERRG
jgi:hypothetical protein